MLFVISYNRPKLNNSPTLLKISLPVLVKRMYICYQSMTGGITVFIIGSLSPPRTQTISSVESANSVKMSFVNLEFMVFIAFLLVKVILNSISILLHVGGYRFVTRKNQLFLNYFFIYT
jgi:hypothetical protein